MAVDWKQYEGQIAGGTFLLRQYLGSSGETAVFLTDHGQKHAAIRLIEARSPNAESQLLRWNEAAKIAHPNLLQIYTTGRWQINGSEILFVVMEYAEENLSEVLPHRPLTPVEAIDMLRPVLGALGYIHEKGFVHGNLKPGNITAIGDQVKLTSDTLSRTGIAPTTDQPDAYDPPENNITPARDIWALGILLAEVLTLKKPTLAPGQAEPSLPENLPQPFLDIVKNCLRREPQLRWSAAQALARLHQPTPAVTPIAERVPTPAKQTPKAVPVTPPKAAPPKQDVKPAPLRQQKQQPAKKSYAVYILIGIAIITAAIVFFVHRNSESSTVPPAQVAPTIEAIPVATAAPTQDKPSAAQPATIPTRKPTATPKPSASPAGQTGSGSAATAGTPLPEPTVTITMQGVSQSEVTHQDVPSVPQKARETITGKIRVNVKVTVDLSGKVVDAELESPSSSKYFSDLALQSARHWQFAPSSDDTRQRTLHFVFQKSATDIAVGAAQ